VLEHALARLRRQCEADGKRDLFDQLKASLTGESGHASYLQIGNALGMTEGAVKQATHRLRATFREQLYAEGASTIDTPDDVDAELSYLISALSA